MCARFSRDRILGDLPLDGCGEELVIGLLMVVGVVLLVLFGWPLLLLLADLIWLVLALAIGPVVRVVFRRPWRVAAVEQGGTRNAWNVVGLRAAGRLRDEVAHALAHGADPATAAVIAPEGIPQRSTD